MIVLAHGCFDILHIGHFRHLRQAREFGDRLVVSITAARFVNKGPGHPAHTDEERLEQLAALRFVDEVYLCDGPSGERAILLYRPGVYAKGCDYAAMGITGVEADACRTVGAKVVFTGTEKRSIGELTSKFQRRIA